MVERKDGLLDSTPRHQYARNIDKKTFHLDSNCPLADSPSFIVNKFGMVWGDGGGERGAEPCTGTPLIPVNRLTRLKTLHSRNFVGEP